MDFKARLKRMEERRGETIDDMVTRYKERVIEMQLLPQRLQGF